MIILCNNSNSTFNRSGYYCACFSNMYTMDLSLYTIFTTCSTTCVVLEHIVLVLLSLPDVYVSLTHLWELAITVNQETIMWLLLIIKITQLWAALLVVAITIVVLHTES